MSRHSVIFVWLVTGQAIRCTTLSLAPRLPCAADRILRAPEASLYVRNSRFPNVRYRHQLHVFCFITLISNFLRSDALGHGPYWIPVSTNPSGPWTTNLV